MGKLIKIGFLGFLSMTFFMCINPYKEFEEIPDALEDPALELHFEDFIGNSASDLSGKNRVGIIENHFANPGDPVIGNQSSFLECKGDGKVEIPDLDLSEFNAFTFSFWVNSYQGGEQRFLSQGPINTQSDSNQIWLGNDKFIFGDRIYKSEVELNDLALDGNWKMISIVSESINSTELQPGYTIYVNGREADSTEKISYLNFSKSDIPALFINTYGRYDNVRIYSRSLNKEELSEIYREEENQFEVIEYPFTESDNLIYYYTFDDQTGKDSKGNQDALLNSGVSFSVDTKTSTGNSAMLDNGTIRINPSFLDGINSASFSFWIKVNNTGFDNLPILTSSTTTPNSTFKIIDGILKCGDDGYGFDSNLYDLLIPDQWNMITVTVQKINQGSDSANMYLFINGVNQDTQSDNSDIDFFKSESILIGTDGNGSFFNGLLDNFRIYNKELSPEEVLKIYKEESQ